LIINPNNIQYVKSEIYGAEKGSECVKVDLSAEDEDIEKLEAFAEELVAKAN